MTGAAGFIGGAVARNLRGRGDQVVAIVRDPARAGELAAIGAELVQGTLDSTDEIERQLRGADGLIHVAGAYRIGILAEERPAMLDANVGTTTRVLGAAAAAGTSRIVYTSTVNVYGNTHGRIVDETCQRDLADGFRSYYDQTKYRAHEVARARISAGAPLIIALPSQVYGPGDHSEAGRQLGAAYAGKLHYVALADVGLSWCHVDDLADGIVRALDRGRVGEEYILAGPSLRLREAIATAARVGGRRPPRVSVPTALLRLLVPLNRRIGAAGGLPANLAETISAAAGVTYWANPAKAERELGFVARDVEAGLRATFGA